MATQDLMSLFGGGAQVTLRSEDDSKLLQLRIAIEVPDEEEYPDHGTTTHTGLMHVDLTDAKDLYDTLGMWLHKHGVVK